jgi:hypothetical protein
MSNAPLNLSLLNDEQFEDLVEAIFRARIVPQSETSATQNASALASVVISVSRSGRGQDGGLDLSVTTMVRDCIAPRLIRWVVQCKHKASSGRSVAPGDFAKEFSFPEVLLHHNANSYLLVCSTRPSAKLKEHFDRLTNESNSHQYIVWDYAQLCEVILPHEGLMKQFFPHEYERQRGLVDSRPIAEWARQFNDSISPDAIDALSSIVRFDSIRINEADEEGKP